MTTEKPAFDIHITGLTKIFQDGLIKKKAGVKNLNLQVPRGEVVGLLGPNGSGKSTTLKMILGFLRPTSGEILVLGHPVPSKITRSFIGYLPENPRFPRFLKGKELLNYYGGLLGLSGKALSNRADYLLELVGLSKAARERVQGFSKGMVQRLAIAQSLLGSPKILIFDEPMSGLDPIGRIDIRALISDIHQQLPDTTLFFSSHVLEDVEQLCSSVALLKQGELKVYCPIQELLHSEATRFDVLFKEAVTSKPQTQVLQNAKELSDFLVRCESQGKQVLGVKNHRKTLEEALFREGDIPTTKYSPEVVA